MLGDILSLLLVTDIFKTH